MSCVNAAWPGATGFLSLHTGNLQCPEGSWSELQLGPGRLLLASETCPASWGWVPPRPGDCWVEGRLGVSDGGDRVGLGSSGEDPGGPPLPPDVSPASFPSFFFF